MARFESVEDALQYYETFGARSPVLRRHVPARPGPGRDDEIEAISLQYPFVPDSWLEFAREVVIVDRSCGAADLSPVSGSDSIATALEEAHRHGATPYSRRDEHDRVLWVASYECSFVYVAMRDCVGFLPGEVLIRDLDEIEPSLERLNSSMTQFFLMAANIDAHEVDQCKGGIEYDTGLVRGLIERFTDDEEQANTWRRHLGIRG